MKRLTAILLAIFITAALCACGARRPPTPTAAETSAPGPTAEPDSDPTAPPAAVEEPEAVATPVPTPPPAPSELELPPPAEGWADSYLAFLEDNYDILAALWPEGLTGVGFIDLDLDGTPEMVLFDLGISATLGVQLFDLVDGQVVCVSSVQESAAGAFGDEYFSRESVCTSYFESFRLSKTEDGYCFWVISANGTMESSWDELIRFDSADGVLTPVSVCARYLECDENGVVVSERYTVGGQEADSEGYAAAAAVYTDARDTGYDAKGVFLWNDMQSYDTTYDGLLAIARDAVKAYVPIAVD